MRNARREPTPAAANAETLDNYRWLIGPEAGDWLAEIAAESAAGGEKSLLQQTARLRSQLSSDRVHLLLQQHQLRQKARAKFPHAGRMFFTQQALEQATDSIVAAYKAARFPTAGKIADFCCGIGGDLLALAGNGKSQMPETGVERQIVAIDRDPISILLAEANLRAVRAAGAISRQPIDEANQTTRVDFQTADLAEFDAHSLSNLVAWHIDPDRRPAGRRTTKVELHEPGPEVLQKLLSICPNAAIKLAPAANLEEPWWADAELEWISRGRECRQLVAWSGSLAEHRGLRRATVLKSSIDSAIDPLPHAAERLVVASFVGKPDQPCPIAAKVCRFVFEPDAAVLAAKLEGALAQQEQLSAVAGAVAYFTADRLSNHAALTAFEVLEAMPYRVKSLRQWLAARGLGWLEIKKRGVPLEPTEVLRELKNDGHDQATILLARIAGRVMAIVAKRIAIRPNSDAAE